LPNVNGYDCVTLLATKTMKRMRDRRALAALTVLFSLFGVALIGPSGRVAADALPKQLSDRAFWQMIGEFSEPNGYFPSDNVLSNERTYQEIIPELQKRRSPGGVYLGVGPDQNLTYITALGSPMAFIIDIRRQNMIEHLLFKALVEMSGDRADFLSRLFSRPRPAGLARSVPLQTLFDAYDSAASDEALFQRNLQEVETHLIKRHGFELTIDDRRSLAYVYGAFFSEGPRLRYSFPRRTLIAEWFPTYAQLLMASDAAGSNHSYLASDQNFRTLREFERRNLLIPIVGDFAGGKAVRAVGQYVAEHGSTINYFYTSNVEQYLFQGDAWQRYGANVAALPLNSNSTFIRAYFDSGFVYPPGIITPDLHSVQLSDPIVGFLDAFHAGRINAYSDLVAR
jgi:hypothetical protein